MDANGLALVTGAGRGLGRAIALELADRGFDVVAAMRDPATGAALVNEGSGRRGTITLARLDITALGDYEPPPDLRVLINNAGYRGPYFSVEGTPLAEWRQTFETNLFGVAELIRRALPALRSTRGVICNVASSGAFFPMPFYSVYRASKAALGVLDETLSLELAPFGIRVIEIPTGPVDTEMMASSFSNRPADAVEDPLYRPLAERQFGGRQPITPASPEEEARGIVDEVLRDEGPLRRPAVGGEAQMVERWRTTTDQQRLDGIRRALDLG